jgi:hypothetical protein
MTKAELGEIICKTFALYFFFKAAGLFLVNLAPPFFHPTPLEYWNYTFFVVTLRVIPFGLFSIILWFRARQIGRMIVGNDKNKVMSIVTADSLLSVVIYGFGFILLIPIIVDLSQMVSMIFYESSDRRLMHFEWLPRTIRLIFLCLLSMSFIFGADGIKNIIHYIRHAGRDKNTDENAANK